MARVRIMTSIATTHGSYRRGDVVDLDDAVAESWAACGWAVPAGTGEEASPVVETTAARTGRPRARRKKTD